MTSPRLDNRHALLVAVLLAASGAVFAYLGIGRMFSHWTWLNDMHYFYDAARVVNDGRADILYDLAARVEAGYGPSESDQVFPYPVPVAYLLWPLTLTDIVTARYVFLGASIAAMAGIAAAGYVWSKDWRFAAILVLLPASSFTFYEAVRFNQLPPFLALMLCVSMLSAFSPKSVGGGLLNGLLVLKPSVAALPLLLLTLRRDPRQVAAAAAVGALLFIVLPLAMVGLEGLREYADLLSRYRDESFLLHGKLTAGAGWMLGWQAIVGRLTEADPSLLLVVPLSALSVLAMLRVWLRGDWLESWLAAVLTTLLVVPHVIWYDWMVLMAVAPFAAYRNRSPLLLVLLLGLNAAVSFDSYTIVTEPSYTVYPLPTPLLAFAVLCFLALQKGRARSATGEGISVGKVT